MILDYLSLLPHYQRLVKFQRWGFDPLDCFSTPALLFYQTQILIRINILFPGPPKDCFSVVFRALASGRTTSRLRRGILFEICSLAGNCKMILAMVQLMWCSSCCHCFGNTCVTYLKKIPDVLERNLYRFRFTWVCLKVVTWISYHNGHKLVISGDNDNDDN